MDKARVNWIALPNGIKGGYLRLSIFLAIRLHSSSEQTELDTFDEFTRWPETIRERLAGVHIATDLGSSGEIPIPQACLDTLDLDLWTALFPSDTLVRSFKFNDLEGTPIRSFPIANVVSHLLRDYGKIARDPVAAQEVPVARWSDGKIGPDALWELVESLGDICDREDQEAIDDYFTNQLPIGPRDNANHSKWDVKKVGFWQAYRFYNRPKCEGDSKDEKAPPELEVPRLDFHEIVAALGDAPDILRRLGLVLDVTLPCPEPDKTFTSIRVLPMWRSQPTGVEDWSPATKVDLSLAGGRFLPKSEDDYPVEFGQLNLGNCSVVTADDDGCVGRAFKLLQVDGDGMALKTLHFATGILPIISRDWGDGNDISEPAALPSIRSAGIALVRSGRAVETHEHLVNVTKRNPKFEPDIALDEEGKEEAAKQEDPILTYQDLLRGYRVDIMDTQIGTWQSLCRRFGAYYFPEILASIPIDEEPDREGYVKRSSATSSDESNDLYLHETLFTWDGWSLCAPRPGRKIRPQAGDGPQGGQEEVLEQPTAVPTREDLAAGSGFPMATRVYAEPGTLPRLRFGREYKVRVRCVDLAGNSLSPLHGSSGETVLASDAVRYLRYEPVNPPNLVPRAAFTEGESLEHMVIRSNYDEGCQEYIKEEFDGESASLYASTNERHVAPPKTSQLMAEAHGKFDEYIGQHAPDHEPGYWLALREEGSFEDDKIVDVNTGELEDFGAEIEMIPSSAGSAEEGSGSYTIHKEETLHVPFLPDPLARGVALVIRNDPDVALSVPKDLTTEVLQYHPFDITVIKVPFADRWPDLKTFRIRLAEFPDEPTDQDGCGEAEPDRRLSLAWDAGTRVLTVHLGKAQTAPIRYSSFFDDTETDAGILALMPSFKQPEPPEPELTEKERAVANLALNGCHWMLTPYRELNLVHAVQQPLCAPTLGHLKATKAELGDTHAVLTGITHIDAKSTGQLAWRAEWDEWVDLPGTEKPTRVHRAGHVFDRAVEPHEERTQDVEVKHEFSDTRHRAVRYSLCATSRFREYFPPEVTEKPCKITRVTPESGQRTIPIPSSARPLAPSLLYVVPTFGWSEVKNLRHHSLWTTCERTRIGGGLRVYLDRPWYSSGDGELLGVVLWADSNSLPKGVLAHYVSLTGRDPIARVISPNYSDPPTVLAASDFLNPAKNEQGEALSQQGVRLAELDGQEGKKIQVIGFEPQFDVERKLWYCDIHFSERMAKSYHQFVRLALVRYQPHSREAAHISTVVLADYAQIPPSRTLKVSFTDERTLEVQVSGHNAATSMYAYLEMQDPSMGGELGWRQVPETPHTPSVYALQRTTQYGVGRCNWIADGIALPEARTDARFRVVVKEFEEFQRDLEIDGERRVAYFDTVEL